MHLSLKGWVEVRAVYNFPLILYQLSVLPLTKDHRLALTQSLFKLLSSGWRPIVCRQICYQRPRNGSLGMPYMESYWLAERLAYLGQFLSRDTVRCQKGRDAFPCLESSLKTECHRKHRGEVPFEGEWRKALRKLPGSSDLSRSRKELYRELVVGFASDPLVK